MNFAILAGTALSMLSIASPQQSAFIERSFDAPIDALSVLLPAEESTATVSGRLADGSWTAWQTLTVDNEQDPSLLESNLLIFPSEVSAVRVRGIGSDAIHPIAISRDAVRYNVAATFSSGKPTILTRSQWGADDNLLFVNGKPAGTNTEDAGDNGDVAPPSTPSLAVSARVQTCLDAQKNAPEDFKTARTVTTENGKELRWKRQYSKKIKLLAVHHTAIQVSGDERSGVERMRALYTYHSNNRGWGDVGYHYIVDEEGQIYEGKSGGDFVVAGHAYCNNVGTIGIALMGNFEEEEPTQRQIQSLQWLLSTLAERYDINTDRSVSFHGTTMEPIVGHRDLLSTDCPGFYAYGVLDQVREHVSDGDLTALVTFPKKPTVSKKPRSDSTAARRNERLKRLPVASAFKEGITPAGSVALSGRASAQILFTLRYQAGSSGAKKGHTAGAVTRSSDDIGLWMDKDGAFIRVRDTIALPKPVPAEGQLLLRMRIQLPSQEGTYSLTVGDARLTLQVTGRALGVRATTPTRQTASRSSVSSFSSRRVSSTSSHSSSSSESSLIRIRLKSREAGLKSCREVDYTTLLEAYRGTINCVTVDGAPALINTLSLEEYMMGLAEEPDTEPYEKQRAFAIAARTYALFYMDPANRKFPGKPYDGSDSPAEFQKYSGRSFEAAHPRWVVAVTDTAREVLTKNNKVIKPPYFSSDDGRTKSPDEVGWTTFPFKEIFVSKPDPWCEGMENRGHGVGMSGCGAEGQANEGKSAEEILLYYYPGTTLQKK